MRVCWDIASSFATVLVSVAISCQAVAQAPAKVLSEKEKTVQITLHPMAQPRPALKHQLLPSFLERRPGNAAVWWNRLPADQTVFLSGFGKEGGLGEKIDKWMDIPLRDPREKEYRVKEPEVANLASKQHALFSDMEHAAQFETCDWELPIREENYFAMRLPGLQQSRTFAKLLSAKVRLEIAEGKYDQAVRSLQVGFAQARHLAQGSTLIHGLVGMTIASMMTRQIEQFVQQPNAPNLYWSLSTLPQPLIDLRPGLEAEMNALVLTIPELRDLNKKDLSAEQWRELFAKVVLSLASDDVEQKFNDVPGVVAVLGLQGYPAAKEYLLAHGHCLAEVEAMPVAKAVLLHLVGVYEEFRDDHFKWLPLPYPQSKERYAEVEAKLRARAQRHEAGVFLANMLLPAIGAVKRKETQMQWTLAHLQIFEALRMYAATHDGKLPERLSEITDVLIPLNPFEDKPFLYQCDGNRAILTNEQGPPELAWRYEITMLPK
jgi:hypothetical protein